MTPNIRSGTARVLLASLVLSAVLVLSFACGGGNDNTSIGSEAPGAAIYDVTMTDTGNTPNDYTVATGSTLTLNFTNKGTAAHNVRVAGADNQYNTSDDAVSDPDLIIAGGKGKLTWKAPSKAGAYNFHCDYHPDLKGTIMVK
jgi:Copper binding proteins, plastocyanin/azurin family.